LIKTTQPPVTPGRTGLMSVSLPLRFSARDWRIRLPCTQCPEGSEEPNQHLSKHQRQHRKCPYQEQELCYITDALGAATLISGGVALYFLFSHSGVSPKPKSGIASEPIVVAPTVVDWSCKGASETKPDDPCFSVRPFVVVRAQTEVVNSWPCARVRSSCHVSSPCSCSWAARRLR